MRIFTLPSAILCESHRYATLNFLTTHWQDWNHSVLEEVVDSKYLGVTLSTLLSTWRGQNILQPWQTRLTPSFRFCNPNLKGCPENLKQTAYFSLIRFLWSMAPLFVTQTKSTTVIRLRGCSVELQGSLKVGIQDTLLFLICLMSWSGRLFHKGDRRLDLFKIYKINNGLVQVPFESVLVEAYKGTRRKHNLKFRQISHTTSQYRQSYFPKTISAWNGLAFAIAPSLAVSSSNFL